MAVDLQRTLTAAEPDFIEVVNLYPPETLTKILYLADIKQNEGGVFLTRVFTIVYNFRKETQQPDEPWKSVQREALELIIKDFCHILERLESLNATTLEAIAIQAKIHEKKSSGKRKASRENLDEPIRWEDADGVIRNQISGRPTDPKKFQQWVRTGTVQFLTKGGEQLVQDALIRVSALNSWVQAALETTPKRGRGALHEIVVRRAIRRFRAIWLKHTKRPAGRRGRFPQFVEVILRPALHGYWPPGKKLESAIRDVIEEAKSRERPKTRPSIHGRVKGAAGAT